MTHQQLRRRLWKAIPRDWHFRQECCGRHVDPTAKWRADVLASKQIAEDDYCLVALEAQLQSDAIGRRSDAYLRVGVWPLWFFVRIPQLHRPEAVLDLEDVARVPALLAKLEAMSDPTGKTWIAVQDELHRVIAEVRAAIPSAPLDRAPIRHARRNARHFVLGYKAGYVQGWADAVRETGGA